MCVCVCVCVKWVTKEEENRIIRKDKGKIDCNHNRDKRNIIIFNFFSL